MINATGVLLHTNLGRAPGGRGSPSGEGYANLEVDLETGRRGLRGRSVADLLRVLTGAEDAVVVNNGAAAILLVLTALAAGTGVVVSRGQLVEIGGGVRIPDILEASGARLVEVGTTNVTRVADFARELHDDRGDIAALLVVHQSNFEIRGFAGQPSLRELTVLPRPVVVDLGSGLLDATAPWLLGPPPAWLGREPAVRQTLADGAAAVTFSGDKLLGGPQAGIIAGSRELVGSCREHPLARALRPGRVVLEQLQQVLLAYAQRDVSAVPFWRMATMTTDELRVRANADQRGDRSAHRRVRFGAGRWSAPDASIASIGLSVPGNITGRLRRCDPPVLARVSQGATLCDLRTVDPCEDDALTDALRASIHGLDG